ncbi:MAG: ornithine cyclodeaminase family protein [Bacteroidota bacterium]
MLILDDKTIFGAISYEEAIKAVEEAMVCYNSGDFLMPDRMHIDMNQNTLLLMPCVAGHYFGTKLVSVFPNNVAQDLPAIMGTMMLNDGKTGQPLAIFDAASLTAIRTGAVGGVAVKYLAPEVATTLGLVGIGVQGLQQAFFACTSRNISSLFFLNRNAEKAKAFTDRFSQEFPNVKIHPMDTVEEIIRNVEIVITATNSADPVLPDNAALLVGKTYIAVGSYKPTMREMPDAFFSLIDTIYVDTTLAIKESGDVHFPLHNNLVNPENIKTLGKRIIENSTPPTGTIFFKSVGMGLFDVMTAKTIYEKL